MSTLQEAIKKAQLSRLDEPAAAVEPVSGWAWVPHLLMFFLLAVALWNYLSEREYRRQMEARLETAISQLEMARADVERVERQSRQMEDLLHAELAASNGRIAKMKFDLETLRAERDSADAALSAAHQHILTLQSQNRRLHEVVRDLRGRPRGAAASASVAWDLPAGRQTATHPVLDT